MDSVHGSVNELSGIAADNSEQITELQNLASDENDRLNILLDEKEILVAQLTASRLKEENSVARIKELGHESNQRQEREAELTSEIRNLKQEQARILHRDFDLVSEKVSFYYVLQIYDIV